MGAITANIGTAIKLGFFMGSFDPIHIGHIDMVRILYRSKVVDKVILVPSGHNPWKKIPPQPFEHRVALIREGIDCFIKEGFADVSLIESTFEAPFTANKPLNHFKEIYPDADKYIICGADTFEVIHKWKNFDAEIKPFYKYIVFPRNGIKPSNAQNLEAIFLDSSPISISSTEIREELMNGRFAYPLINKEEQQYISEKGLYMASIS